MTPNTPIGEILKAAGTDGIVLESEGQGRYAVIPLDDDLIDFLVERSPSSAPIAVRSAVESMPVSSRPIEEVRRQLRRRMTPREPSSHTRNA